MIRYYCMILNHLFLHLILCHIIKIAYLACMILAMIHPLRPALDSCRLQKCDGRDLCFAFSGSPMAILDIPPPRIPLLSSRSHQIRLMSTSTPPPPPPALSQSTTQVLTVLLPQVLRPKHAAARHSSDPTPWRQAPRNADRPPPNPPRPMSNACSPPGPS